MQATATSQACPSYHIQGFCILGEFCPHKHAADAVSVNELDFFYKWENIYPTWTEAQNKRKRTRAPAEVKSTAPAEPQAKKQKTNVPAKQPAVVKTEVKPEPVNAGDEQQKKVRLEEERKRIKQESEMRKQRWQQQQKQEEIKRLIEQATYADKVVVQPKPVIEDDFTSKFLDLQDVADIGASSTTFNLLQPEPQTQSASVVEDEEPIDPKYQGIDFSRPLIPYCAHYRIPRVTRQKMLDKLVENFMKKNGGKRKLAVIKAIEAELQTYDSCNSQSSYSSTILSVLRKP